MPDEITPIHIVMQSLPTVEEWPARTSFDLEALDRHRYATVDGDMVTFAVQNGTATYRLLHDEPKDGNRTVAELVAGDTPSVLRRRLKKFEMSGQGG